MADQLINSDVLASFRELQTSDDPHFVRDYFLAIIDSFTKHLDELEKAISAKNFSKIATHAHAVKSTSANSGISKITELAAKIEALGNGQSADVSLEMYNELKKLCEAVKKEILILPELKK